MINHVTHDLSVGQRVKYLSVQSEEIPYGTLGTVTGLDRYVSNWCDVKFDGFEGDRAINQVVLVPVLAEAEAASGNGDEHAELVQMSHNLETVATQWVQLHQALSEALGLEFEPDEDIERYTDAITALRDQLAAALTALKTALGELHAFTLFTTDCPHCEGSGTVVDGFDEFIYEATEETCPHCNGTGNYVSPFDFTKDVQS